MGPINPDIKAESNYVSVGASISSSLSFSSILPSLSGNNCSNGYLIQQSSSQIGTQQGQMMNNSAINIPNVTTETTMTSITPISSSNTQASPMTSIQPSVSSMLVNFQPHQVTQHQPQHNKELVKIEKEPTYVDVTPFLILPQHEAARRLGVPCSTLSKRWKEASVNRKWPYRIVCKLDKEITTLLKNVENNASMVSSSPLSPAIEESLGVLLKKRQEELRTVVIRIN